MAGILTYSDKTPLAMELITAAQVIAQELNVPVKCLAINDEAMAQELSNKGAAVYQVDAGDLHLADTASVAGLIKDAAEQLDCQMVLLSSNRRGKEWAGRLAQKMEAGCLTDLSSLHVDGGKIGGERNALGGATIADQAMVTDKQVIAVTPKSYDLPADGNGSIEKLDIAVQPGRVKLIETAPKAGDTVDIEAAEILVAVGQGLEDQEDIKIVEAIAESLGGEVACSKPLATDKKWFSEERIIGLSGKKCKPELAILMGISGQVQFTVGIRDAKVIAAINNDENATIMGMSDYALVADLKDVLPSMQKALG